MAPSGKLQFEKAEAAELGFRFRDVAGFSGTVRGGPTRR
jgi:hypothetical protein